MNATRSNGDVEVQVIADITRGTPDHDGRPREFTRVSLRECGGHPYLSVRLFWRDDQGQYWPHPKKGTTVRLSEAEEVSRALLEGLSIARERRPADPPASPPHRPLRQPQQRTAPSAPREPRPSAPREVQVDAFDDLAEFRR